MIKLQNDITKDRKDPLAEVYRDARVIKALDDIGIDFNQHAHPDFRLTMANGLKEVKPNTLAIERIDGCQVKNKNLLKDPNLLRLVKMYKYKDMSVANLSCTDGRIFTRFLSDKRESPKKYINYDEWNKVTLGCSFLHYKRHDMVEHMAQRPFAKNNDVFFAGTTQYGTPDHQAGKLITIHRTGALRAVRGLKRAIKTITGGRQTFRARDYLTKLGESRVTVSPWGWGESCYRDYEALILETDVIKPQSYAIQSMPDIYTNTVFYCKPDWSNLQEVIEKCLDTHEERKEQRKETAKRLIEWRQPKAIAGIIENIIKEVK